MKIWFSRYLLCIPYNCTKQIATLFQVYEGLDDTYTTNLSPDTHSSFKIRVKRDTALQPLFGPFSQTLFVKMKPLQALPEEKVREELSRNGPENLEVVSEDRYIIVVILLALCLPAVLAIFYLVSFWFVNVLRINYVGTDQLVIQIYIALF